MAKRIALIVEVLCFLLASAWFYRTREVQAISAMLAVVGVVLITLGAKPADPQ